MRFLRPRGSLREGEASRGKFFHDFFCFFCAAGAMLTVPTVGSLNSPNIAFGLILGLPCQFCIGDKIGFGRILGRHCGSDYNKSGG